jgi:hypothetical protein
LFVQAKFCCRPCLNWVCNWAHLLPRV